MAATTSGTKTVTTAASPTLSAAALTTIMATPVELLTVAQLHQLHTAVQKVSGGGEPTALLGALLR